MWWEAEEGAEVGVTSELEKQQDRSAAEAAEAAVAAAAAVVMAMEVAAKGMKERAQAVRS